jgi:hypothetical protein
MVTGRQCFTMRVTAAPAKLIKLSASTVDEKQMFRIGNTVNRIIAYAVNMEIQYCGANAPLRVGASTPKDQSLNDSRTLICLGGNS